MQTLTGYIEPNGQAAPLLVRNGARFWSSTIRDVVLLVVIGDF